MVLCTFARALGGAQAGGSGWGLKLGLGLVGAQAGGSGSRGELRLGAVAAAHGGTDRHACIVALQVHLRPLLRGTFPLIDWNILSALHAARQVMGLGQRECGGGGLAGVRGRGQGSCCALLRLVHACEVVALFMVDIVRLSVKERCRPLVLRCYRARIALAPKTVL